MSKVADVFTQHSKLVMNDVKREWGKHGDKKIVVGDADIEFQITQDTPEYVVGKYSAWGQKMWILEYGKGRLIDRNSPSLSDYKKMKFYNKNRNSPMEIRTRGEVYDDIDGNEHIGLYTCCSYGLDTNKLRGKYKNTTLDSPPMHIFRENVHREGSAREAEFMEKIWEATAEQYLDAIDIAVKRR